MPNIYIYIYHLSNLLVKIRIYNYQVKWFIALSVLQIKTLNARSLLFLPVYVCVGQARLQVHEPQEY